MCETRPGEGRDSPQSRQFAGWGCKGGAGKADRAGGPSAPVSPGGVIFDSAAPAVSGEGGIRTLEAGIPPPNALARRRLQPLGHFSGGGIVPQHFRRESPPRGGLSTRRRERDLNSRCTF